MAQGRAEERPRGLSHALTIQHIAKQPFVYPKLEVALLDPLVIAQTTWQCEGAPHKRTALLLTTKQNEV